MKVVLNKDVKDVGKAGEVVNVAEGYARNFLLPRKLAVAANEGVMKNVAAKKQALAAKEAQQLAHARDIAAKLKDIKVTVEAKVGSGTKLYGSVTSQEVADALAKQHKLVVDKRQISMREPIKSIGSYDLSAKLHHEVTATIHVDVVGKQE